MTRMLKLGLAGAITALALSSPVLALDVGERVPRLTLTDSFGQAFPLPSHQRPEPTVVWFPFPWRTPHHLFEKLLSVTENNHASLVIIPIFDVSNVNRLANTIGTQDTHDDLTDVAEADTIADRLVTAPYGAPATSAPAKPNAMPPTVDNATESPTASTATTKANANLPTAPTATTEANANLPTAPTATTETNANLPTAPAAATNPTTETPGSDQEASTMPQEQPDSLATLQSSYLKRLKQMEHIFPKAYFVNDCTNAALIAYTQFPETKVLPNPNLFIIDPHGYIAWEGFYPGLTSGTLSRAIANARMHKHNQ